MSKSLLSVVRPFALILLGSAGFTALGGNAAARFPAFTPTAGLPEGIAVDKSGTVYASVAAFSGTDQLWKFSRSGQAELVADFGGPSGGAAGLAVDAQGNVYYCHYLPPNRGVFRVSRGGAVELVPGTDQMVMPNSVAFDPEGALYITETYSIDPTTGSFGPGGIWRVPRGGVATVWLRDELLTGVGPTLYPFPVGANGIAFRQGQLLVVNTDKNLVVEVAVNPDGSPGQPAVWAPIQDVPESFLYQSPFLPQLSDGIALDVHGNAYVAIPSREAVVRIDAVTGVQETLGVFPFAALDVPLSLAFGTGKGERTQLFITNNGISAGVIPGLPWSGPGILKIDAGTPGLPLP